MNKSTLEETKIKLVVGLDAAKSVLGNIEKLPISGQKRVIRIAANHLITGYEDFTQNTEIENLKHPLIGVYCEIVKMQMRLVQLQAQLHRTGTAFKIMDGEFNINHLKARKLLKDSSNIHS